MTCNHKKPRSLFHHQVWNSCCLLLIDGLILVLALLVGDSLLWLIKGIPVSLRYSLMIIPVWWVGAWMSGQAPGWGLGAVEELRRIELLLFSVFALAGVAYVFGQNRMLPSRIVYLTSYAVAAFLLPFGRMGCRRLLAMRGLWGCGVVLYGDRQTLEYMMQVLGTETTIGYRPAGIFSDDFTGEHEFQGMPILGGLMQACTDLPVAVASLAHLREKNLTEFVDHILSDYRKVLLLPDLRKNVFASVVPRDFNGLVGLEVSRNLLNPFAGTFKRVFEIALVLLFVPLWVPLLLGLALLVFAADRHNPFYRQVRIGRDGRLFKALKLRTMVPDADKALQQLLEKDDALRAEWERHYKLEQDPRITSLGRFLRCFSLDELPQLINVLAGHMALVGPRPLPIYHQEELSENARRLRNRVRPGMTGQWQISGRSDCGVDEMEQWDSFYVRNWSIWMDIYILARTIKVVLFPRGAY